MLHLLSADLSLGAGLTLALKLFQLCDAQKVISATSEMFNVFITQNNLYVSVEH